MEILIASRDPTSPAADQAARHPDTKARKEGRKEGRKKGMKAGVRVRALCMYAFVCVCVCVYVCVCVFDSLQAVNPVDPSRQALQCFPTVATIASL